MLMVFEGQKARLLTGELKWKHRESDDTDAPWVFHADRIAPNRLGLVTNGSGGFEGTPDEVIDNIVETFVTQTEP